MRLYLYYNREPNEEEKDDCVCRAISTATNLKYEAVENLLKLTAEEYRCDKLCVSCYENLLSNIFCYPIRYCKNGETVGNIAKMYSDRKVIIRIDGHLTCGFYSTVLDIWDCTDKKVDCYWVI